jgi:hypothetical protein
MTIAADRLCAGIPQTQSKTNATPRSIYNGARQLIPNGQVGECFSRYLPSKRLAALAYLFHVSFRLDLDGDGAGMEFAYLVAH